MTASRFALTAIVARRLSEDTFGQFAYAQWLVDLAFLACSFGATGVASRYLAEYRTQPDLLAAFMARWRPFAFGLPFLASGAVVLGAQVSNLRISATAFAMLALWTGANGYWLMQTAALTGLQRFDQIFRANVLGAVVMLVGVVVLPLNGDAIAKLFGLMAAASAAASIVGIALTRRRAFASTGIIERASWRRIRSYAFNIWVTALLWSLVWSRGEMPIVRSYLGDAGVASYAAAMTLFGGFIQGVMLAVSGVAPQLTMLWGSGRRDEAIATARTVMDIQLLLCGAGALVLIFVGKELVALAFGSSYQQASAPLAIFAVGLLAMAISSQNHVLQIATDARFSRNASLLGLVLLFGMAIVLTPLYGLRGAAFARAGTMDVLALVSLIVVAGRWGRGAITTRNVVIVVAVVSVCAFAVAWFDDTKFFVRAVFFIVALVVVGLTMQDRHGRLLALLVPRFVLKRSRKGVSEDLQDQEADMVRGL